MLDDKVAKLTSRLAVKRAWIPEHEKHVFALIYSSMCDRRNHARHFIRNRRLHGQVIRSERVAEGPTGISSLAVRPRADRETTLLDGI